MNEQPPNGSRTIFCARTATVFGLLLLAAYGVVAAMLTHDRRQGAALEHLEANTAVGVPAVYQLPERPEGDDSLPTEPVLVRDGTSLYARKVTDRDEWLMLKAGTDDSGEIPLYHYFKKRNMTFEYYVKLAPGEYLLLATEPRRRKSPPEPDPAETPAASPVPPSAAQPDAQSSL